MKKKIILVVLAILIAASGIVWVVLSNVAMQFDSKINEVPQALAVSGNGSSAVMVDDYLYFVGAKTETSTIKYNDNDYFYNGEMPDSGIYRLKMNKDEPDLTYEYDNSYIINEETGEKGEYTEDDEEYNTNITSVLDWEYLDEDKSSRINAVVPKIAGHDQTAMWVFGNNLIYATPNNLLNKTGQLRTSYLDFYRVDLDGKNHELIYSAEMPDLTTANFTVWADSTSNIYLLINEDAKLKRVDMNGEVYVIDEDVTGVVFPIAGEYKNNLSSVYGGMMSYVYYTKNRDAEEDNSQGNLMYKFKITGDTAEKIADQGDTNSGITFTPIAITNEGFVFMRYSSQNTENKEYCIVTNPNENELGYENIANNKGTYLSGETVKFYSGKLWLADGILRTFDIVDGKISNYSTQITTGVESIMLLSNDYIYVKKSGSIETLDAGTFANNGIVTLPMNAVEEGSTEAATEATLFSPVVLMPADKNGSQTNERIFFVMDSSGIKFYSSLGEETIVKMN